MDLIARYEMLLAGACKVSWGAGTQRELENLADMLDRNSLVCAAVLEVIKVPLSLNDEASLTAA